MEAITKMLNRASKFFFIVSSLLDRVFMILLAETLLRNLWNDLEIVAVKKRKPTTLFSTDF